MLALVIGLLTSQAVTPVKLVDPTNQSQAVGVTLSGSDRMLKVHCVSGCSSTSTTFGAAFPSAGSAVGFSDGTSFRAARVFDLDSGAGTEYSLGVNLRLISGGASVEAGTSSNPLRVDPTGTTTQPVSATALDVNLSTRLADSTFTGRWPAAGALAENFANPTTTQVGAFMMLWDGAAWDRAPGNSADGALVNLGTNNDVTVTSGSVDIGTFPDNEPVNVAQMNGVAVTMGNGASGTGVQRVTIASDSTGTVAATQSGTWTNRLSDGTDTALVSGTGSLQVTCDNCGGASPFADDDAFTPGTTAISIIGAEVDDVATTAATENSAGAPRMSTRRELYQQIRDAAGNERGANVNASNALLVAQTGELPAGTQNIGDVDVASFPDNEPINVAQMNGVAVTMGNGISGTGVQRVTIASDSTGQVAVASLPNEGQQTMANSVSVALASDQSTLNVDLDSLAGNAISAGNGVSGTGVQRVTIASDSTGQVAVASLPNEGQQTAANSISVTPDTDNDSIGATAAAPPGEATFVGGLASGATGGFLTGITVCDLHVSVDIVTATTVLAVTGVAGRHVRICAVNLVSAGANNVAIVAGTGATCATSTAGMNGGVTAAEGWNFAANGGIAQGTGLGEIMRTETTGDSVCIITSAAVQLSGNISYTIY